MKCKLCETELKSGLMQCHSCKFWNLNALENSPGTTTGSSHSEYITLDKVTSAKKDRILCGPWDYVFGGGIVRTSCNLIGGAPGAGKSTLFLQIADAMAFKLQNEVAYIATEEALEEIKERAERLNLKHIHLVGMISAMGGLPNISEILDKHQPAGIFLDSVQGLAGQSEQVAIELCNILKKVAVIRKAPVMISSHVNKSDEIAGLMALQHVVDCTSTFFPDEHGIRIHEIEKNRNGAAFISTSYQMTATGLEVLELEADKEVNDDDEEDD